LLLQIKNISLARGDSYLRFPDIALNNTENLLLLGASGSGKTSLFSMIAGLLTPSEGNIFLDGADFYSVLPHARDRLRGRKIGFVFQNFHLLSSLSISENILLAAKMANLPKEPKRLEKLLATLGLTDKGHRKPHELSQGERQRAAIARAVYNKPSLLIADEPTSALDDENALITIELLKSQAQESGAALLLATHDQRIVSGFDKIVHLDKSAGSAA